MAVVEDVLEDDEQGISMSSTATAQDSSGLRHRIPLIGPPALPPASQPLLQDVPPQPSFPDRSPMDRPEDDGTDEWFDTLILTVPFCFLYLLLDILVHLQYQHRPTLQLLGQHMLSAIPTLGLIVFYTNRYPTSPLIQLLLISASVFAGTRLIWLVNKAGWSVTTAQAPAAGTLWILTIVQLPLSRAVLTLAGVAGWVWWTGMKVTP